MENSAFNFKNFSLYHNRSTLKIGTDSVLLASTVPIQNVRRVLDIGCGCGVIAFCIADRLLSAGFSNLTFQGVDVDADSIDECRMNAANFPHQNGASFDFQQIPIQEFNAEPPFDLIVSNPPFFCQSLKPANDKRLLSRHRDETLSFNDLVSSASRLLAPSGHFYVILPHSETDSFERAALQHFVICEKIYLRPTPAKPINRCIWGLSKSPAPITESCLVIRDASNSFSDEYRTLTRQFYLAF